MSYPNIKVRSFNFSKAFRIEFERNYEEVKFYTRGFLAFGDEILYANFYYTQVNYYALLKAIPPSKLEEKDRLYINRFFSNLSDCRICGYKAVFLKKCYYCTNYQWDDDNKTKRPNTIYESEDDYIKELQMDWELDEYDHRKNKASEKFFEKCANYEILFTREELMRYVKEQEEL